MLLDPVTTWLFVRISPVELMIILVPAAAPPPTVVLTSTIAGTTFAAMASTVVLLLPELPVPGLTGTRGDSGCEPDCAIWCVVLTALARLQPMPAPAAAATKAMSTRTAAMRFHMGVGEVLGGAGAHTGGAGAASGGGGSNVSSGEAWEGSISPGFSTDISTKPPLAPGLRFR